MKVWNRVAIVGVGLIGGSIGLALLRRGLARQVVGIGRNAASLAVAQQSGSVTETTTDLSAGVAGAELVVVCTPVDLVAQQICEVARACDAHTVITDAASTKGAIVACVEAAVESGDVPEATRFLGSHPLAGNEKRGPENARADLFAGRVVVLTPTWATHADDRHTLSDFWSALGARVVEISPTEHDRIVALTSHLPHVVAAAIAAATPEEYVTLTAGGWLDTTRIAAGDPVLWRQILLSNRDHVLAAIDQFGVALGALRAAVARGEPARLEELLEVAKRVRDAVGS